MRGVIYISLYVLGYAFCASAALVLFDNIAHDEAPGPVPVFGLLFAGAAVIIIAELILRRKHDDSRG